MSSVEPRSLTFFIAMHEDAPLPPPRPGYAVIGLGGFRPVCSLPTFSDSEGDSISDKNRSYSELTGWYWLWKNLIGADKIALCHYRRLFLLDPNHALFMRNDLVSFPAVEQNFDYLTSPDRSDFAEDILTSHDLIVPRRVFLGKSIAENYRERHVEEDWANFVSVLTELYPEYADVGRWFDLVDYIHPYNMMIVRKPLFDDYMAKLFAVLEGMERRQPFTSAPYQQRAPGFIAERFFTFYLSLTHPRCFEVPVATFRPAE